MCLVLPALAEDGEEEGLAGVVVDGSAEHNVYDLGQARLRQFVAYVRKVFSLRQRFEEVIDGRKDPTYPTPVVAKALFFCGLLRIPSLNALEPRLQERTYYRLVDPPPELGLEGLGSADTAGRVLRRMDLPSARALSVGILAKAERNKVFREGWHGTLRICALDGWEPISSYERHCPYCLERTVRRKNASGETVEVTQYYHRYVVAMLIDERLDLVLDIEPVLPADLRDGPFQGERHEGEHTAAIRLIQRVKQTFRWIDAVVADALYANGVFLTVLRQLGLGAVIVAKKETDEPLKEALNIWGRQPPEEVVEDDDAGERIELWDCRDVETLDTYKGKVRVVRAQLTRKNGVTSTWCMLVVGKAAKLSPRRVLAVARGRWHIENTGFHQWVHRWKFGHVFVNDGHGILALFWLFFVAYNLLTLFLYRQLCSYGRDRGNDVTRTISRLVDEMRDDLARLTRSPWMPAPG